MLVLICRLARPVVIEWAELASEAGHVDLASAWDVVGKTKTDLWKMEHRLDKFTRQPWNFEEPTKDRADAPFSSQTPTTNSDKGMKARRKVSRLEDRYTERPSKRTQDRKSSQSSTSKHQTCTQPTKHTTQHSTTQHTSHYRPQSANQSPKRVDFHNRLDFRKLNPDGTYTDSTSMVGTRSKQPTTKSSDNLYSDSTTRSKQTSTKTSDGGYSDSSSSMRSKQTKQTTTQKSDCLYPDSNSVTHSKQTSTQKYDCLYPDSNSMTRSKQPSQKHDTSYTDNVSRSKAYSQKHGSSDSISDSTARAIRETDIRFINNHSQGDSNYLFLDSNRLYTDSNHPQSDTHRTQSDYRTQSDTNRAETNRFTRPKFAAIDMNVSSNVTNNSYSSRTKMDSSDRVAPEGRSNGHEAHLQTGSDSSGSTDSRKPYRSRNHRDLNRDSDEFARLREKILKRGQTAMAKSDTTKQQTNSPDIDTVPMTTKTNHHDDDIIQPKTYDIYPSQEKIPRSRKVAPGPVVSSYRGFSSVEAARSSHRKTSRKQSTDGNVASSHKKQESETSRPKSDASPPKKMSRIVSTKEQRAKPKHTETITTSSWRAGQAAILEILGPSKLHKGDHSQKPPKPSTAHTTLGPTAQDRVPITPSDPQLNVTRDLDRSTAALSDTAKQVLSDLHLDQEHQVITTEHERRSPKKVPTKRKAPKPSEPERPQTAPKARHYDTEEVRRFMDKQKHDRIKKTQQDRIIQEQTREKCRRQLEELATKRKEAWKKGEREKSQERVEGRVIADGQPNNGSDKENEDQRGDPLNISGGSSTLTGEGEDSDSTPVATPLNDKIGHYLTDTDKPRYDTTYPKDDGTDIKPKDMDYIKHRLQKDAESLKDRLQKNANYLNDKTHISSSHTNINTNSDKTYTDKQHIDKPQTDRKHGKDDKQYTTQPVKDDRTSILKDTKPEKLNNSREAADKLTRPTPKPRHHPKDETPKPTKDIDTTQKTQSKPASIYGETYQKLFESKVSADIKGERSRTERILAIRQCASLLQSRINAESSRLNLYGGSPRPSTAPAKERPPDIYKYPNTVTDHDPAKIDRLLASTDYSAFTKPVPDMPHPSSVNQPTVAMATQVTYPGYTASENLMNSGLPAGLKSADALKPNLPIQVDEDGLLTEETSTFSDITYTEDTETGADSESSPPRKIGAGLHGHDFHAGDPPIPIPDPPPPSAPPQPRARRSINWDDPQPDPHSIISIITRKRLLRSKITKPATDNQSQKEPTQPDRPITQKSQHIDHHAIPKSQSFDRPIRIQTEKPTLRSETIKSTSSEPKISDILRTSKDPSKVAPDVQGASGDQKVPEGKERVRITPPDAVSDVKLNDDDFRTELDVQTPFTTFVETRLPTDRLHNVDSEQRTDRQTSLQPDSYSDSFITENVTSKKSELRGPDPLDAADTSHSHAHEESLDSELSSLADERPEKRNKYLASKSALNQQQSVHPDPLTPHPNRADPLRESIPPRYSPNTLERRMMAELNRLDSMEVSMMQLVGVEKSRGVALAQQETVSLAQIIKSRQQEHDTQMRDLRAKAEHEREAATEQLEDARKRTSEAAQSAAKMIATLRHRDGDMDTSTRRLKKSQSEAAKATAAASRQIRGRRETNSLSTSTSSSSSDRTRSSYKHSSRHTDKPSSKASAQISDVKTASDDDLASKKSLTKSASVRTAADSQQDNDSSVKTASDADADDGSKAGSVSEDLPSDKGSVEYSMRFDESMTEDEIEEKSFRMVLPSESHRRTAKRKAEKRGSSEHSDSSVVSDEMSTDKDMNMTAMDELSVSLFTGEESFHRFTSDMVSQYMREEELRAQHQATLLTLREKALKEKTKAELDWLEQQKRRMKNKGADDAYPQVKKKQRGIMMRLQQQQAELRRLQEANKSASKERQLIIRQQEEIKRLRDATKQKKKEMRQFDTSKPEAAHTEDEISRNTAGQTGKKKGYKSDSEVHEANSLSKRETEAKTVEKFKKLHLNESCLTQREQKLHERRKNAEQLLAWKRKLDEEEAKIYEMERQALEVWKEGEGGKTQKKEGQKKAHEGGKVTTNTEADVKRSKTPRDEKTEITPREKSVTYGGESFISESIAVAKDSIDTSISEQITKTKGSVTSGVRQAESSKIKGRSEQSGSESSITEDLISRSSETIEDVPDTGKLRPDEVNRSTEYGDDTFASADSPSVTKGNNSDKLSRLRSPRTLPFDPLLSPKSPRSSFTLRGRGSESESEDSVSHTETASDQSDVEGRIRALKEELSRRKLQVDRLKKDQKQRQKERLKSQELALLKQIDAYDNYIKQCSTDLQSELEHEPTRGVKPQIKQPRSRDTVNRTHPATENQDVSPRKQLTPQRSESESSRSSISSSFEENKDSVDASQATNAAVIDILVSPTHKQKLESISEKSESKSDSLKSSDKAITPDTHNQNDLLHKISAHDKVDKSTSEITEEIDEVTSVVYSEVSEKSDQLKLDIVAEKSKRLDIKTPEVGQSKQEPQSMKHDISYDQSYVDTKSIESEILPSKSESVTLRGDDESEHVKSESEIEIVDNEDILDEIPALPKDELDQDLIKELSQKDLTEGVFKAVKVSVTPERKSSVPYSKDETLPQLHDKLPELPKTNLASTSRVDLDSFEQSISDILDDKPAETDRKLSPEFSVKSETEAEKSNVLSTQEKSPAYTDDFSDTTISISVSKPITGDSEDEISEALSEDFKDDFKDEATLSEKSDFWLTLDKKEDDKKEESQEVKNDADILGTTYVVERKDDSFEISEHGEKMEPIVETSQHEPDTKLHEWEVDDIIDLNEKEVDDNDTKHILISDAHISNKDDQFIPEDDHDQKTPVEKLASEQFELENEEVGLLEQTISDISLASESELDRAISCASAAVESFHLEATPDETLTDGRALKDDEATDTQEVAKSRDTQDRDATIDRITRSLAEMVVKDSIFMMSDIAVRLSPQKAALPTATITETPTLVVQTREEKDISEKDISLEDISEKHVSEKDISDNDMSEKDFSEKDISEKDISEKDISEKNISDKDKDISEKDISEKAISEKDVSVKDESEEIDLTENDITDKDISEVDISISEITEDISINEDELDDDPMFALAMQEDPLLNKLLEPEGINDTLNDVQVIENDRDETSHVVEADIPSDVRIDTQTEPENVPQPSTGMTVTPQVTTDTVMSNLLNEALDHMISIRKQKSDAHADGETLETSIEKELHVVEHKIDDVKTKSDYTETNDVQEREEFDLLAVPRPHSPAPGDRPRLSDLDALDNDVNDLLGTDEYIDDDYYLSQPPPPYPGTPETIIEAQQRLQLAQEPVCVVPNEKQEISTILSSAVDVYWSARERDQPLDTLSVPLTFYQQNDALSEQENKSCDVYNRMLFDLAGEVVSDIFDDGETASLPPWQKAPTRIRRFSKVPSRSVTRDKLDTIVRDSCCDILRLNKTETQLSQKWGGRRKKDHVDHILVQELRQDEPGWVNYDADELAVKFQLSDTILEYLLSDTTLLLSTLNQHRDAQ